VKPPKWDSWQRRFLMYQVAGRIDALGNWLKKLAERLERWLGYDEGC
jgi:hypothetical protein